MTFLQPPIGLPRIAHDGEILNSGVRLGGYIGSGNHGTAHEGVLNGERVCFKRYHLSWCHAFTSNPAKSEYDRLIDARNNLAEVADSIQSPIGWYRDPVAGTVLVSRLVQDYTGAPSQSLKHTSGIAKSFFHQLESIFAILSAKEALYNPVAANILVQRTSESESRPVLIDFTNYESYVHYMGKRVAHFISPESKRRHIKTWLDATLAVARNKVFEYSPSRLDELSTPPRPPL
jgi:hypothetical protein